MLTLVTGVSGYVGSALVARLQRDGHAVRGFARSRERVDRAGALPDELVLGDVDDRRGPRRRARGRRGRLLPDPLDGGRRGRRVRRRGAALRRALRRGGGGGRGGARRLPRRARPGRRAALPPPGLPPRGRARAARRRARVGRAAGVDRDRRPLALLPLPRAADRADARDGAAGVARQPHRADRRPRRARVPRRRGHRARRARRPVVGHRRPGRDDLRGDDRPDRRRADAPPAEPVDRLHHDAGGLGRGGGDRGRGSGADRPADGVAGARPAPARGRGRRRGVRGAPARRSTRPSSGHCATGSGPRSWPGDDRRGSLDRDRRPARAGVGRDHGPAALR